MLHYDAAVSDVMNMSNTVLNSEKKTEERVALRKQGLNEKQQPRFY